MSDGSGTVDLARVLREIDEEVQAKRRSGELPAGLERELDLAFARFAPTGAIGGDFESLLARAEQQAFIDVLAPNESVRPGAPQAKRVIQKLMRWYMRYVAEQVSGFGHTITKAVKLLGQRVEALEALSLPTALADDAPRNTIWDDRIVELLSSRSGRVLHARCGDGDLVSKLIANGVDAYGVDPKLPGNSGASAAWSASGLDLRNTDECDHLSLVPPAALGAIVLSGSLDVMPRGAQISLIESAALALEPGGVLILVTANPIAWAHQRSVVESDLAIGRPLHGDTWKFLLEQHGFSETSLSEAPSSDELHCVGEATTDANFTRLNQLLFPSPSALVIGYRTGRR